MNSRRILVLLFKIFFLIDFFLWSFVPSSMKYTRAKHFWIIIVRWWTNWRVSGWQGSFRAWRIKHFMWNYTLFLMVRKELQVWLLVFQRRWLYIHWLILWFHKVILFLVVVFNNGCVLQLLENKFFKEDRVRGTTKILIRKLIW